jgi:hypothetical protein
MLSGSVAPAARPNVMKELGTRLAGRRAEINAAESAAAPAANSGAASGVKGATVAKLVAAKGATVASGAAASGAKTAAGASARNAAGKGAGLLEALRGRLSSRRAGVNGHQNNANGAGAHASSTEWNNTSVSNHQPK